MGFSCTFEIPILLIFFVILANRQINRMLINFFYAPICCPFDFIKFVKKPNVNFNDSALSLINMFKGEYFYPLTGNITYYSIKICQDGEPHDGIYCSTGRCNMVGCNCDGSCFSNNKNLTATEMFKLKYGDFFSIESYWTSPINII